MIISASVSPHDLVGPISVFYHGAWATQLAGWLDLNTVGDSGS